MTHTDTHTGQTYIIITKKGKHKIRSKENPDVAIGVTTRVIQQYLDSHPDLVRDGRITVDEVRKGTAWRNHLEKFFRAMSADERARARVEYYGQAAEDDRMAKAVERAEAAKEIGRWAWGDDRWYIRYTGKGMAGDTIQVQRKDGSVSNEVLGRRVAEGYWITPAQVSQDDRNESARRLVNRASSPPKPRDPYGYDEDRADEEWIRSTQFIDMHGEEEMGT